MPSADIVGTIHVREMSLVTLIEVQLVLSSLTDVTAGVPVPAWKLVPVIVMVLLAVAEVGETAVTVGYGTGLVVAVKTRVLL